MGVYVFPILKPLPLPCQPQGSSQCTSPEHPVPCIQPGLVISSTYNNIHVSMLFSQIIPTSPSRTESKRLLCICISFAASHIGLLLPSFQIPYTCVSMLYSPGEGNGNPLQYSCLGNPMDRGACWFTVHGVAKSWTWLSMHMCILYWCFSFWLTSLCIIGSSVIHLIRPDSNVLFLMAEQYSIVYMYHSFFIHSPADGHLDCFHILALIRSVQPWN